MWKKDKTFLKNEIYQWVNRSKINLFNEIWDIIIEDYDEQKTEDYINKFMSV